MLHYIKFLNLESPLENANKAFVAMHNRYTHILNSGFKPARDSTGYTEQNLAYNFVNALVKELGPDAIEWLEFPWEDKKQHIDAVVFSKLHQCIYYIEAKRFMSRKKVKSLDRDIDRIQNFYRHENFHTTLEKHNIDPSYYSNYVVAIADVWNTTDRGIQSLDWWNKEAINNTLIKQTISDDLKHCTRLFKLLEQGESHILEVIKGEYNLLLAVARLESL